MSQDTRDFLTALSAADARFLVVGGYALAAHGRIRATGDIDILVAPNIETGNALFKAMVYFMSATAAGLVMGARVPIVLTSRADPPEARLAAAALAAIVASSSPE